ncbi:MAG: cobaltochelatase subunit CobN [Caldilineaceae bacterium]
MDHCFGADAVLHFGTHGALEFMPGKQSGMSVDCWPTRLLEVRAAQLLLLQRQQPQRYHRQTPGAAATISYLVPPLQQAGLYKGPSAQRQPGQLPPPPVRGPAGRHRHQAKQLGIEVEKAPEGRG